MSPVSVTVPAVKQLVVVNNVNNVQMKNFRLMHTNDGDCSNGKVGKACDADGAAMAHAALTFQHSHGAAVSNCTFDSLGGWALQMIQSDNASVQRVAMRNVGAGGANLHSSRNMVMNNSYVKGFGQRYPAGEGINMASCLNCTVSHNSISGGHCNGPSGGGNFDAAAHSVYVRVQLGVRQWLQRGRERERKWHMRFTVVGTARPAARNFPCTCAAT